MIVRTGIVLLAIFFDLASLILFATGIALLWPGTAFDAIWLLAPERAWTLMPYRLWLGPFFLALMVPVACASYGFFRQRGWARTLAIAIFAANGLGDAMQIIAGHTLTGLLGVCIAGLVLLFLTDRTVRAAFVTV
ncbi:MAG TPA: hypothetical protein VGG10_08275 [Rhizomicrobium sp.]|jgi:hypothetical protein